MAARSTPTPARRPRNFKTPRQRAEETLATRERQVASLKPRVDAARAALDALEKEYEAAVRRHQHAAADPDLHDELDDPLPLGGES